MKPLSKTDWSLIAFIIIGFPFTIIFAILLDGVFVQTPRKRKWVQ